MKIKKYIAGLLALIMIMSSSFTLSACTKKDSENAKTETEEKTDDAGSGSADSNADSDKDKDEDTASKGNPEDIVTTITPDAEDVIGKNQPMQIESITLYKDGSIEVVPTDDLKKNELADSKATSLAPFAESGKAKEIYLCRVGNDGYRVVLALMDDGTISAVNTLSLFKDHIFVVMDRVAGRDNFVGVEETKVEGEGEGESGGGDIEDERNGNGFSIIGKTETGDDVVLDSVLFSDSARAEAGDEEEADDE